MKNTLKCAFIYISALVLMACSDGATNTAANSNRNANRNATAANTVDSQVVVENTSPQADANKKTEEGMMIEESVLTGALKSRLRKDDKHSVLTAKEWDADEWLEVPIGLVYKNDDEFVNKAVREVTTNLLKPKNLRLTKISLNRLEANVNSDSKCKTAADEMLRATTETEFITKIR